MSFAFERVGQGRRLAAISVDSLACFFIITATSGGLLNPDPYRSFKVSALLFTEIFVLSALQGATLGHRIFGIKIVRFEDGGQINPLNALIRTLFLMLVVTAVTFDDDGRGIHERLSGSVLTRSLR